MAIVKDLGMVTAYAYAVAGGYEGTEAEFTELLGQAGVTLEQLENLSAVAVALSPGSEATASYENGVLTFGIPQGEKGDKGDKGNKGDTGNGIVSITKAGTSGLVDTYMITFTDGTTTTFTVTNGADGDITNVAEAFDSTKAYSVGDMVLYQGTLYAFTVAHSAGAWVGSDAQAVILAEVVADLKGDLSDVNERMDTYVSLTGENEVEPQNIAGVTFTRTEVVTEGDNIFTSDMLFEENYYVAVSNKVNPPAITHSYVSGYKSYCIPVEPNTTYHFPIARFFCTAKGNTLGSVATSETGQYNSTITTADETAYLFLTYATDVEDMYVKPVEITYDYSNFAMPDWMTGTLEQIANDTTKLVNVETDGSNIEPDLTFTTGYMSKRGVVQNITTLEYSNKIEVAPSNIIRSSRQDFRFICAFNGNTAVEAKGAENIIEYVVPDGIDHVVLTRYKTTDGEPIDLVETESHYVNIVQPIPMGYMSESGSLSDGDRLVLPYHNVKNKNRYVFNGNITSFSSIKLQKGTSDYITVSASNVVIHNDQGGKTVNYPSGFVIDHDVTILIENEESIYLSKLTIESAGHVFDVDVTTTPVRFLMDTSAPVIESIGSTMTDCRFSWVSENINQPIWIFGDSYVSWYDVRWVNYAVEDNNLKSSLLSGYAGEASTEAMNGLKNLLKVTTPKIVVWCLGMNNGDSDSAVNASWLSNYNKLVELSEEYDFEIVLYTTPTTPTINNNFKNAIVRDSGYRYVDADGAVRIDSDGHWVGYNTDHPALSNDNVHPTEIGAKILYYRFLADLPELMSR